MADIAQDMRLAEAIIDDATKHIEADLGGFDTLLGLALCRLLAEDAGFDLHEELRLARLRDEATR